MLKMPKISKFWVAKKVKMAVFATQKFPNVISRKISWHKNLQISPFWVGNTEWFAFCNVYFCFRSSRMLFIRIWFKCRIGRSQKENFDRKPDPSTLCFWWSLCWTHCNGNQGQIMIHWHKTILEKTFAQSGNFRIFLPLWFCVKSKLVNVEPQKLPF